MLLKGSLEKTFQVIAIGKKFQGRTQIAWGKLQQVTHETMGLFKNLIFKLRGDKIQTSEISNTNNALCGFKTSLVKGFAGYEFQRFAR